MNRRFFQFVFVGAGGFAVDVSILYLALSFTELGYYAARAVSLAAASSFAWAGNRLYTFADHDHDRHHAVHQWGRFLAVAGAGAALNFALYSLLIWAFAFVRDWPVIGVAAGGLAALAFNYRLSRMVVFYPFDEDFEEEIEKDGR